MSTLAFLMTVCLSFGANPIDSIESTQQAEQLINEVLNVGLEDVPITIEDEDSL